ncbi:HPr family phosphocarrier protein [Parvularcula oceani]|uniref:HPr family phosphocarrier protein n=1 Tax=Parvularcula oceani TaxID=1247963 RepID=UPI0004E26BA6|nr:HPr family phosphocarrier protein [Parvularcula oceani]
MNRACATVAVRNRRGLHARASARFCEIASGFQAEVTVTKDGVTVGGCSLMALLMLGAGAGSEVTIRANGDEAEEAVEALSALVAGRFGEES